jgi:hypothetical protein
MSVVVHPATGELLDLSAPTEDLARWLTEARELDEAMRTEKRRVVAELLDRMDRDASYTIRVGSLELKGDGPEPPTVYDGESLRHALQAYVDAEVISPEALDRAVEVVPTYKPRANGLKALLRQGGALAQTVLAHAQPKENYERRVSVKPRGL